MHHSVYFLDKQSAILVQQCFGFQTIVQNKIRSSIYGEAVLSLPKQRGGALLTLNREAVLDFPKKAVLFTLNRESVYPK